MTAAIVVAAALLGLYCLLRWGITADDRGAAVARHPAGKRAPAAPVAVGRHRGDLAARMTARHRREQLERELGWVEPPTGRLKRSITSAAVNRVADEIARHPETSARTAATADLRRIAAELAERGR